MPRMIVSEYNHHNAEDKRVYESKDDIHYHLARAQPANFISSLHKIFLRTFLPIGYPNSVRKEYLQYQIWDSLQGLCSYLRSVLTTQSILIGAGVGSTNKTALAATLVWIMKDGMGMLASLLFAYYYSDYFEVNSKEFRLLADFVNNIALILNLCISLYPQQFLLLSCMSAICSSLCGLIAGATKAHISAHFAVDGHLADVTAKESTQETAVTLCGLVLGYILAKLIGDDKSLTWIAFIILLVIHQYANYILVRVLILDTLNPQRCWILMKLSIKTEEDFFDEEIIGPESLVRLETLSRPFYLGFYGPRIGASISVLIESLEYIVTPIDTISLESIYRLFAGHPFLLGFDCKGRVVVCLEDHCSEKDQIKAYFIALYIMNKYPSLYLTFHITKPDLKRRYSSLILTDFAKALDWWENGLPPDHLVKAGWDVESGKTRLGTDCWRYAILTKKTE